MSRPLPAGRHWSAGDLRTYALGSHKRCASDGHLSATARFLSGPGLSAFPHGPTQRRATSGPPGRRLAIPLRTKEMRRVHTSAVRDSSLARVPECDMRPVGCGFVFPISAESAIGWPVRSVAEHRWFGLDHGKSQEETARVWNLGFGIWGRTYGRLKTTRRSRRPAAVRASC